MTARVMAHNAHMDECIDYDMSLTSTCSSNEQKNNLGLERAVLTVGTDLCLHLGWGGATVVLGSAALKNGDFFGRKRG